MTAQIASGANGSTRDSEMTRASLIEETVVRAVRQDHLANELRRRQIVACRPAPWSARWQRSTPRGER